MYTIIINDDKSLTTSVRTALLRHSTTDKVQLLWKPMVQPYDQTTVVDGNVTTVTTKEAVYTALFYYKDKDGITKSEGCLADEELYKERARFVVPPSSAFFNNRGMFEVWVELDTDITIVTEVTTVDEETGIETKETTQEVETIEFTTLSTQLFIGEVPHDRHHHHDNNVIKITRGDSLTVNVVLTDNDGFEYEPVEGDEVWFTVKKSAISTDVLIRKSIDITNLVLDLVESDTKDLAFGKYVYEIEVITNQDDHYTVIKNAPFIITEELH